MFKRIIHYRSSSVSSAALVVAGFTVFGTLFSLVRNSLLASRFGAGRELDMYYAAFRIPDFIYSIFYLGVISVIFLPVFTDLRERAPHDAWRFFGAMARMVSFVCAIAAVALFIAAPAVIPLIVPGFNAEELTLLVWMTRIMLLQPIILGVSNLISGVLQSFERFVSASLAHIAYNSGIILGIFFLVPQFGIVGLAWGVVVGALMHLAIQLPAFFSLYKRSGAPVAGDVSMLRPYLHLIPPRIIGIASAQINILIITALASRAAGSVSVFTLAQDIQAVPQTVIAVSLAVAAFPALSRKAFTDAPGFSNLLTDTVRKILLLLIPASIFMIVFRAQIVRLILGYGAFGWENTILTLETLLVFGVGIAIQGLLPILMRAFFAIQNTRVPLAAALLSNAVVVAFGPYLAGRYGAPGLAGAFVGANLANVLFLLGMLAKKRLIRLGILTRQCFAVAGISLAAAACGWGMLRVGNIFFNTETVVGLAAQTALAVVSGIVVLLVLARALKVREYEEYFKFFFKSRHNPQEQLDIS